LGADAPTASSSSTTICFPCVPESSDPLFPILDEDNFITTEPGIFTEFDPAEAISASNFAAEFNHWGSIFSFPNLPPLPATLYPEASHCKSFTELLSHSVETVRKSHDYDACRQYAAQQIEISGAIDLSLADTHLQWMTDMGIIAACARSSISTPRAICNQISFKPFSAGSPSMMLCSASLWKARQYSALHFGNPTTA
jgi:hypothetical protein